VEKYRTKSIKLFLVGVKEKLPTKNAKKGRKGAKKWVKYVPEPMAWKINGKNSGNNLEIRKRELPLSVETNMSENNTYIYGDRKKTKAWLAILRHRRV